MTKAHLGTQKKEEYFRKIYLRINILNMSNMSMQLCKVTPTFLYFLLLMQWHQMSFK